MKRDMDIIRALLLSAETKDKTALEAYPPAVVCYHCQLLIDADFVEGWAKWKELGSLTGTKYSIERLTWEGHEFLDAMRSPKLWQRAKDEFMGEGMSWTARMVFEWLQAQLKLV